INIVEIRGRDNSSTAKERHAGFDVITKVYNTMPTSPNKWNILASVEASWQKDRAKAVMDSLLKAHDRIDYVYCHSDFMAKGAYEAIKAAGKEKETLILSVDALPQDGAGLDMVINKQFLATYTNPVPGIEAMDVAHSILSGEKFRKTTLLGSEVVDSTNAEAIKYHYEKSHRQDAKLHSIETIVDEKSMTINRGKWVFAGNIVIILLLVLLFLSQRRVKKEINNTDDMMMMQLQMQIQEAAANKIAQETTPEATTEATAPTPEKPQEVIPEAPQPDPFFAEVEQIIIKHIGDSNFSVNDIADELGMSRIQLYRKIKTRSEKNVSDLIRTARLERAYQLLTTTHKTISEIAFKVGFSSPSYFTKCFKEHYGYGPSEL
ncbi:MAG: helix-turn-helix domain-containing protein, partial [Bacteroidaceae bacterium]|nr:helix-turn-helix domain-containing protein [Bacteroidaceae bacterium]